MKNTLIITFLAIFHSKKLLYYTCHRLVFRDWRYLHGKHHINNIIKLHILFCLIAPILLYNMCWTVETVLIMLYYVVTNHANHIISYYIVFDCNIIIIKIVYWLQFNAYYTCTSICKYKWKDNRILKSKLWLNCFRFNFIHYYFYFRRYINNVFIENDTMKIIAAGCCTLQINFVQWQWKKKNMTSAISISS